MKKNEMRSLSAAELSTFCGQVALILEAGLPLYDGMETLAGAESDTENSAVYASASKGVTETGSLYQALKEKVIPHNCKIVIAGRGYDPIIEKMKLDDE